MTIVESESSQSNMGNIKLDNWLNSFIILS